MLIPTPLELTPGHAAALPVTVGCALDLHLGPYDAIPELTGWLGADWCRCRRCGSAVTRATTRRNAA